MSETVPSNAAPENPAVPVGMNLEEIRVRVAQEHGESIPKNDPLLMVVTVMNICLAHMADLHKRHEAGLSRLMADKTDGYVKGVRAATDALAEKLSSASAEGLKEVFRQQDARLAAFKSSLFWLAAIVSVSALLNVVVFVLRGMR
jgi:hypothetical protein